MADIAAEHAEGMRQTFAGPVDLMGMSTGGSIAQQIAAQHPDVVRRLVLVSTGCRLGPAAKSVQRRVAARIRVGAIGQACAVFAADLAPRGPLTLLAGVAGRMLGPRLLSRGRARRYGDDGRGRGRLRAGSPTDDRCPDAAAGRGARPLLRQDILAETAALIPNCQLEIRPRLGHVSVLWDPRWSRRCSASSARRSDRRGSSGDRSLEVVALIQVLDQPRDASAPSPRSSASRRWPSGCQRRRTERGIRTARRPARQRCSPSARQGCGRSPPRSHGTERPRH